MRKILLTASLAGMLALAVSVASAHAMNPQLPQGSAGYIYTTPPRFQIYWAPKPYGGMIMVDNKTGETWQRIVVNSKSGITVRWMKLEKSGPKPGETILWN